MNNLFVFHFYTPSITFYQKKKKEEEEEESLEV